MHGLIPKDGNQIMRHEILRQTGKHRRTSSALRAKSLHYAHYKASEEIYDRPETLKIEVH
jgi:hypothetical protein